MDRRHFLKGSASLCALSGVALSGCNPIPKDTTEIDVFKVNDKLPWINWAANQSCVPSWRHVPANEDQLIESIKHAQGVIRPVGSSHSFSPVVPTSDNLISLDLMHGLVSHDAERQQATLRAGTTLYASGGLLASVGQALPNMPDMDYPTFAGAIANSVHATGIEFGSMCSYVKGFRLITPTGDVLDCSATSNPEVFKAGLTAIGSMGVMSEITLQNQTPFALTEVSKVELMEEVLEDIENLKNNNRHWECFPIPYTDYCLSVSTNLAKPGDKKVGEDDPQAVETLRKVFNAVSWVPGIGDGIYSKALELAMVNEAETIRTGPSYKVFPHIRVVRFREMEYTVPADLGPACLREILATIKSKRLPMVFPLEYRYVKADDIWLSMFEGQDGCSISIHQYADSNYQMPFAEIERIFWKYQGRPHWGKLHSLGAKQLAPLYAKHWQDFQEVRQALDPHGRMLNQHLNKLFLA